MCGIAGFVDFGGRPAAELEAMLRRMDAAIAHRGSDGWGRVVLDGGSVSIERASGVTRQTRAAGGPTVGLAHRRLAIIDLSPGGHQPMATAGSDSWLTYNGELYNYRELRRAREQDGARFASQSDTEVLLDLLHTNGCSAFDRLRGMFACAWWDERAGRLVLARDPFGIKPLVFTRPSPDLILFASEPRALMAGGHLAVEPGLGRRAEFLERGSIGAASSFWRGVEVVAPGEWISVDRRGLERHVYWSTDAALRGGAEPAPVARAASIVRDALVESVEAHLVSDVPVGIFLSGGLDSAAILAAAREVSAGTIRTFTVTMGGGDLDEAADAREAARYFGSDHRELSIDGLDVDAALDEYFAAMQEPSIDGINTFLVARAARAAGVTVALSGVGGDELLGGYPSVTEVPALARALQWAGPVMRASRPAWQWWPSPRVAKLARLIDAEAPASVAGVWWRHRGVWPLDDARELTGEAPPPPLATPDGDPFDVIRRLECREFLQRQLLRDADAFTMCRALELRTPLVDRVFAERVAAAGRWPRTSGQSHKASLFASMRGLTVPRRAPRPKRGFVLPMERWMRTAFGVDRPAALGDFKRRLAQPHYQAWVDLFMRRRLHWSRLWALYVLDRMTQPSR